MQAVSQPLFFTYLIFSVWGVNDIAFMWQWIGVNLLVTLTIMASRIYLGAHHLQDIVTGSLLGVAVGALYCVIGPMMDEAIAVGSWRVPVGITSALALLVMIHPNEIFLNTSVARFNQTISQAGYLVSATVAGCASGAVIGSWFVAQNQHLFNVVSLRESPMIVLARFVLGPLLCAALYVGCKKLLRTLLISLWQKFEIPLFDPPHKLPENAPGVPAAAAKNLYMEKTGGTIYLTYTTQPSRKPYQRHTKNAASWSMRLSRDSFLHRWGLEPYCALLFGSGMQVMPIVKFLQYLLLTFAGFFPIPALFTLLGM